MTKFTPEPNSGCWLWDGRVTIFGYGQITLYGKGEQAHRASWRLFRGPIHDGMCVLHKCDVRSCVNPDHLWLGTQVENIADMVGKGRQGSRAKGVKNHNAKLTEEAVRTILRSTWSHSELAAQFGVNQSHISRIKNRVSWGWVALSEEEITSRPQPPQLSKPAAERDRLRACRG